jgi:hypothetical protein
VLVIGTRAVFKSNGASHYASGRISLRNVILSPFEEGNMTVAKVALLSIATAWVTAQPQQAIPTTPVEAARLDNMISVVQRTEVSKLDRKLTKKMAFQDWLSEQGGPNVQVTWAVRYGATEHAIPDCVETNAYMSDGRTIIVWLAVDHSKKRSPYVYRVGVVTGRDAATGKVQYEELDRLRDIPAFLNKLKQTS